MKLNISEIVPDRGWCQWQTSHCGCYGHV